MTDAVTAAKNLFVLAHLGIPHIDPAQWSLGLSVTPITSAGAVAA
jgi:hypothetical protein